MILVLLVLMTKAIVSNPLDFLVEFSANKFWLYKNKGREKGKKEEKKGEGSPHFIMVIAG